MKKHVIANCVALLVIVLSGCGNIENLTTPTYTNGLASPTVTVPTSTAISIPPRTSFASGWITFTNANEQINDLAFDQDGYLWAAGQGGLVKWDTSNGTYKKYTTDDGLPTNRIDSVFADQNGILWIGAYGSISSFDGEQWEIRKKVERQGSISEIFQDAKGKLWFVGDEATAFDGKTWKTFTMEDGLGANTVASITEDNQHNIWLGTWFLNCGCEGSPKYVEGVSRFNGQSWEVVGKEIGLDDNDPSSSIQVNAMIVDKKGSIWFGTTKFGVIHFDGKHSETFTVMDGLSDNTITDMKVAEDGTVWFATLHGISAYRDNKLISFPETTDLMSLSIEIASDQSVWFGTDHGIFHLSAEKLDTFRTKDMIPSTYVTDIDSTAQGAVWIGTMKGAVFTDGTSWQPLPENHGLPGNEVKVIRLAPDNTLWVGTSKGLSHLVDNDWIVYQEGHELHDLAFDNSGGLWVGSYGSYYFDGVQWSEYIAGDNYWIVHSDNIVFSSKSGYWTGGWGGVSRFYDHEWITYGPEGKNDTGWDIRALAVAPNGDIWVATDLSDETFHTETGFKSFDGSIWKLETKLGLRDVTDMDFSKEGILWVATRDGAYKYDGISWTHYTIQDGLAGNEVLSIHVAGDGAVWFATSDGLTRFGK